MSRETVIQGLRQIRYNTLCRGSPGAPGDDTVISALELIAQLRGARHTVENAAQQTIQRRIVARSQRMRDDDGRDPARELIDRRFLVFVDVDDDVRRREFADAREG